MDIKNLAILKGYKDPAETSSKPKGAGGSGKIKMSNHLLYLLRLIFLDTLLMKLLPFLTNILMMPILPEFRRYELFTAREQVLYALV